MDSRDEHPRDDSRQGGLSEIPDVELARRIASSGRTLAREEEAELSRRYARRILWYGRRHLSTEDRAQDLVQDVLLVTLEKLRAGEVRDPARIGSFILGTARMVSRTMDRATAREDHLEALPEVPDLSANPERSDPFAADQVTRCLKLLAEKQRTVIVLTFFGEQPAEQIASSLGMSANNVRVIRHRGMAQLRDCLGLGESEGAA